MDISKSIGMSEDLAGFKSQKNIRRYINLKLAALGQPWHIRKDEGLIDEKPTSAQQAEIDSRKDEEFIDLMQNFIENFQEQKRLLSPYLCPADRRIQSFIEDYFGDLSEEMKLPAETFVLDRYGLARVLSLPPDSNVYEGEYIVSHRIKQGILNNPKHDRRTTKGSFHIVEGGPPVPTDKKEVPKIAFARLFREAMKPPKSLLEVPFTASQEKRAYSFVSLYLRPTVAPAVEGISPAKNIEVSFFVPASLVCTLDFVESVFGNAGDPRLIENDAALDIEHWSGHTGCVILAPHLTQLTKKELGLPHFDYATLRQKKDGMCYKESNEIYNDGISFKITARDDKGRVVTIIADNYFGYSKKEVKTQLSYAANMLGNVEEEHAGGAVVFPQVNLADKAFINTDYKFGELRKNYPNLMTFHDDNYATDNVFPNIHYIPENAVFSLYEGKVSWEFNGRERSLTLLPEHHYIYPNGYKVQMEKHPTAPSWRLVGTVAEGVFCHKPCTVSGGGKSEISKSLLNSMIYGSFHISDMEKDFALAEKIINYDYSNRWKVHKKRTKPSRPILSPERSLGSVIKLLTPSEYCTDEYNEFLCSIPHNVKSLVFYIKRFYQPSWGDDWKKHFTINKVNGKPGHELHFNGRKIVDSYLRVGFDNDGSWCVHRLRNDFIASAKIQMEDDITVSTTVPTRRLDNLKPKKHGKSVKILTNCEFRLFQRPDEAIHKGYDKEAEQDLARNNVFITNYQPLTPEHAKEIINDAIGFDKYTEPIKEIIKAGAVGSSFFISPSHPRILEDGKRSTNPRYLQTRPDFSQPINYYLAKIGTRLSRRIPEDKSVCFTVDSVMPARRNNPPNKAKGIKPLSVYNPIHYQELPELFMDFISSLSGKSPSTTGAGSEGALTKGPFNMISPIPDLNNALMSYILTGYNGYTTAAGYIGVNGRFDHDISILIPELFSRMDEELSNPKALIEEGSLEKIDDFDYEGRTILASRLGYRITTNFLFRYFGRVFEEPQAVLTDKVLRPETESLEMFVDGIDNIVDAQRRVGRQYFDDGSVGNAIPPQKALLHIMVYGHYDGKKIEDPEVRQLFDADYVLESDWYRQRLENKQAFDIERLQQKIQYIEDFTSNPKNKNTTASMNLLERLKKAKSQLAYFKSSDYLDDLRGMIGR